MSGEYRIGLYINTVSGKYYVEEQHSDYPGAWRDNEECFSLCRGAVIEDGRELTDWVIDEIGEEIAEFLKSYNGTEDVEKRQELTWNLQETIDRLTDNHDTALPGCLIVWDVGDYFSSERRRLLQGREVMGCRISPEMSDEDLRSDAENIELAAKMEGYLLDGVYEYLYEIREQLRDKAEEENEEDEEGGEE